MKCFCLKHKEYMTVVITRNHDNDTYVINCTSCIEENPNCGVRIVIGDAHE